MLVKIAMKLVSMVQKRKLGFLETWKMGLGFLGIQSGFTECCANTEHCFLGSKGTNVQYIPTVWGSYSTTALKSPYLGGYFSDGTRINSIKGMSHVFWKSQLATSMVFSPILSKIFKNELVYALMVGGLSMILAGLMTFRVDDDSRFEMGTMG
ncbi:MAG: hypothetical protein ACI815_000894 [Psychroserpens sp.]|jgi:hypothetical protein